MTLYNTDQNKRTYVELLGKVYPHKLLLSHDVLLDLLDMEVLTKVDC